MINLRSNQPPIALPPGTAAPATTISAQVVESAFWNGKRINGRNITSTDVLAAYRSDTTSLRPGYFLQKLYQYRILHEGQLVTPGQVIKEFSRRRDSEHKCQMAMAFVKQACCLKNEHINGQEVSPSEVICEFPDTLQGRQGMARFKSNACFMGLLLNGQRVATEEVADDYVLAAFPLGQARFFSNCCLRGLTVHNQPVTTEMVLNHFQACNTPLEELRFLDQCFIRDLTIKNSPVSPEYVVRHYWLNQKLLELGRLKEQCCLNERLLFQRRVCTEEVLDAYRNAGAAKELRNFVAQCCLRGLLLAGQPVDAQRVLDGYLQAKCTRDLACFLAELTLRGKKLSGQYLDDERVIQAFQQASTDFTTKPVEYLLRRIATLPDHLATGETLKALQQAWSINSSVNVQTEPTRHQACILHFVAMQYALPVGGHVPSPEQVWQLIDNLRECFDKSRLKFFFLIHLFKTGQPLHGHNVSRSQIMNCINQLPEGCRLQQCLLRWFNEYGTPPASSDSLTHGPVLCPMLKKSLQIIDRINSQHRKPVLLLGGLFSHYLQGVSPDYDDIHVSGTESAIKTLMDRMADTHTDAAFGLRTYANVRPFSGCNRLVIPPVMSLTLTVGDLNLRTMRLMGSLYSDLNEVEITTVSVPGLNCPVKCLSLTTEIWLLDYKLRCLASNLKKLTTKLQKGGILNFPCPLLFQPPQSQEESVCELLLHCLLKLHQAERLMQQVNNSAVQGARESAAQLRDLLKTHPCREQLVTIVQDRLSGPDNHFVNHRRHFFQSLLALLTND